MPQSTAQIRQAEINRICGLDSNNEHYQRGIRTGNECVCITISLHDVWSGEGKNGASIQSYERIGYHTGSIDFLSGVLSTDCEVFRFVKTADGVEKIRIKTNPYTQAVQQKKR